MIKFISRMKLGTNMILSYVFLSFFISAALSVSLYFISTQRMLSDVKQRLSDDASLIASQLNADQLSMIRTSQDASSPIYQALVSQFRDEMKLLPGVNDIYTMRKGQNEQLEFVVDGDPDQPGMPGEAYSSLSDLLRTHIDDLKATVVENQPYTDDYGSWLSAYAPIFGSDGKTAVILGVDIAADDILAQQRKVALTSLLIFCLVLPVAWISGIVMARYVAAPITELTGVARKIANQDLAALNEAISEVANGNLKHQKIELRAYEVKFNREDEIGKLAQSFNHMIHYLEDVEARFGQMTGNLTYLVGEVSEKVSSVNSTSAQFAGMSSEVNNSIGTISDSIQSFIESFSDQEKATQHTLTSVEQLKRAIQDVALGAQEQSKAIGQALRMSDQIDQSIQQIVSRVELTNQTSMRASSAVEDGTATIQSTITGMNGIKERVDDSAKKVRKMGEHSEKIGQMVDVISDIASQTNLLALNAAIEAARAGESGKGFAVVADEVRKLAEKSAKSTHEISILVSDIRKTVGEAIQSMETGAKEVDKGVELVNRSGMVLSEILSSVAEVKNETSEMATAAHEASGSVSSLSMAMNLAGEVVERNMAATEQMSAASTEVTKSIQAVVQTGQDNSRTAVQVMDPLRQMYDRLSYFNQSALGLAEMAEDLQGAAERFAA